MEHMTFLDFHTNTYEKIMPETKTTLLPESADIEVEQIHPGRPLNLRVPYKPEACKPNRGRVFRTPGHETLPRFIGKWFERSNDPSTRELYCVSMLLLLKPWTTLNDLKAGFPTFDASWQHYTTQLDEASITFVANVNYYYECMDSARARREDSYPTNFDASGMDEEPMDLMETVNQDLMDDYMEVVQTEDDIEQARKNKHEDRDKLLAEVAMNIAEDMNIFSDHISNAVLNPPSQRATVDMMNTINAWDTSLKATRRKHTKNPIEDDLHTEGPTILESTPAISSTNIEPHIQELASEKEADISMSIDPKAGQRPIYSMLNEEQKRAHDIVYNVLHQHLSGQLFFI